VSQVLADLERLAKARRSLEDGRREAMRQTAVAIHAGMAAGESMTAMARAVQLSRKSCYALIKRQG
jgi:hypothetical protein